MPTRRERRHLFTVERQQMTSVRTTLYTDLYYIRRGARLTQFKLRRII